MQVHELKIGNLVAYNAAPCVVVAIAPHADNAKLYIITIRRLTDSVTLQVLDAQLEGVKLSVSVLSLLQFETTAEYCEGIGWYDVYHHDEAALTIAHSARGLYGVDGLPGFVTNQAHRLQNIWAVWHGEELPCVDAVSESIVIETVAV